MSQLTPDVLRDLSPHELALFMASTLDSRQGEDIAVLDVSGPLVIADYFVLVTARNARHATGMAQEIDYALKKAGRLRRNISGDSDSPWVLLDFNEVVLHVFVDEAREFYDLDNLWADVPRVPFTPADNPGATAGAADAPSAGPQATDPHVLRPDPQGSEGPGDPPAGPSRSDD